MYSAFLRTTTLVCVLLSVPAHAKAPTLQVSIGGPDLEVPLHSREATLIAPNVWAGNFVDWEAGPIPAAADESKMYRVHFWSKGIPDGAQMIYVVLFEWDAVAERGAVCFPGERTRYYWLNVSTILRGDADGSCYLATEEWGYAVAAAIDGASSVPESNAAPAGRSE